MYRLGHQIRHHYWPYILGSCIVLACLMGGSVLLLRSLTPHTYITQSKPIIRHIAANTITVQRIMKRTFSVDIPTGWQTTPASLTQGGAYSWTGTAPDGAGRRLDVYIDQVPDALAVNRLLPVQAIGNKLDLAGAISDNCVSFTDRSTESAITRTASAKWDGVTFLCDTGNYERDVTAIGSAGGVNMVTMRGSQTGSHRVMLVYTDNSINPDFTVFTSIVQSFQTF